MSQYSQDDQRAFLQFVTGCPRLPIGSFKALSPPLTIVKKAFDTPEVSTYPYYHHCSFPAIHSTRGFGSVFKGLLDPYSKYESASR